MRSSVTARCETEKLWHPLLLKRFPDGSYLHRAAVLMQTRQRAGGAEQRDREERNNDLKKKKNAASIVRWEVSGHCYAFADPPAEMLLIMEICNSLYEMDVGKPIKKCATVFVFCSSSSQVMTAD